MIFYNIFGHQPTGYVPEVSIVVNEGQVRNVCLDISRAESIQAANVRSMAVLVLGVVTDIMEGIVNFTEQNNQYNGIYTYSKDFSDYNTEQNNGNVILYSGNTKMYTHYIPDSFNKIAEFKTVQANHNGGKNGRKGSYSSRTLKELQLIAKKRGVVYSRLNKKDLIDNLKKRKK
jgi:hypothetical protein